MLVELKTAPDLADAAEELADRYVNEDADLTSWQYHLERVARENGLFPEDPAILQALQLVEQQRAGHVPAWREPDETPVSAEEEAAAHMIAALAPGELERQSRESFERLAERAAAQGVRLTPPRANENHSAEMWESVISGMAMKDYGVPYDRRHDHPIVVRAMHLTGAGELETLDEMTMRTAEATHAADAPLMPAGLPGQDVATRSNPPRGLENIELRVRHLGGHPAVSVGRDFYWLYCSARAAHLTPERMRPGLRDADIEWAKVRSLVIEGPDAVEQRVTIPRVALGGIFAFAKKKEQRRAYLVFATTVGEVILEVDGWTPMGLRGALSHLVHWVAPRGDSHSEQ
jgi:hypothetical protein